MNDATLLTVICAGLCLGSFATALIHRLPRDLPYVRGRSFCPHCRAEIPWRDKIPVASWILLRGRCRNCDARISPRYPAVELAVALLAVLVVDRLGVGAETLRIFVFLYLLLLIAVIDAAFLIIPHTLTVAGLVSGLLLAPAGGPGFAMAAVGAVAGAAIVLIVDRAYRLVRRRAALGGGDAMLTAMIGAHLGPWGVPAALGLGAAFGVVGVLILSRGRLERSRRIPFGPYLALAAVVALLWGERLWGWYTELVYGIGT